MSKEEIFAIIDDELEKRKNNTFLLWDFPNDVKKRIEELYQSIDNANLSEALDCLKRLANHRIEYKEGFELGFTKTMPFKSTMEYKTINQALIKAQEQKEMIVELCEYYGLDNLYPYDDLESIAAALKNARDISSKQRMELLGKLNKQEKVLEIIFEKKVDIDLLNDCKDRYEYNMHFPYRKIYQLTEEEFDSLKEMGK